MMIRIMLLATVLACIGTAKAQFTLTPGYMHGGQVAFNQFNQADTGLLHKKWFVSKYAGLSTGFMAFNGGSGSFLSAPIGVQLNRQLNNNLYAFAGVSIAPTLLQFNNSFLQPATNKNGGFMNSYNFGTYTSAQMGLMYINDDRTFSISGSIGVSRGYYNGNLPYYNPANTPVLKNSRQ